MLLILPQILVKLFVRNIITDLSYNLNKFIQYKHVRELFHLDCLPTLTHCNCLVSLGW